jgi:hypothetical protein
MLQIALLLLALLVPACANHRALPIQAVLCDQLSGDARSATDYSDLTCARQARVRVLGATPAALVDRCIDLGGGTRLEDLFASDTPGRATPIGLGSVDSSRRVAVELDLYAPGAAPCPADAPLLALGRSAEIDLSDRSLSAIAVPLAARKGCGDTDDGVVLDVRYLEDLSTAPTPALALGEVYAYDGAISSSGVCRAPLSHRGRRRLFRASQLADGTGAPSNQVSGTIFFDHSGFAGCTLAHVDDRQGGVDACLGGAAAPHQASMWLLQPDHLAHIRDANRALPNPQNGALVVRIVDPSGASDPSGHGSFVGARLTFALQDQRNEAQYVLDSGWTQVGSSPGGTTADGLGVAVVLDAQTGPYMVDFGNGVTKTFNAGAAADPAAVTTFVVTK